MAWVSSLFLSLWYDVLWGKRWMGLGVYRHIDGTTMKVWICFITSACSQRYRSVEKDSQEELYLAQARG